MLNEKYFNRKTREIENRVYNYIRKKGLINKEDNLILCVSGGSDSVFLLNILQYLNLKYDLKLNIYIMHLNHNLRKEAKRDEDFVKELAEKNKIPFFVKSVDVEKLAKDENLSIELAGRKARKDFLEEIKEKIKKKNKENVKTNTNTNVNKNIKYVTGHNADDVVETVIYNMARGTGTRGLIGIEAKTSEYIRPILSVYKKEIEYFLNVFNIDFVVDKTNFENDYTRNKIRNVIIPILEEQVNSKATQNIYEMTEVLGEDQNYLDEVALSIVKTMFKNANDLKDNRLKIHLNEFNNIHIAIRKRMIYHILKIISFDIQLLNKGVLEDILNIAQNKVGGKYIELIDNNSRKNKNDKNNNAQYAHKIKFEIKDGCLNITY